MNTDFSYSLEALERRWQLKKTPQIGLRLAEQYGFQEKISAAIETLAAGLEVYPTHTASRVALSRHLVDTGRFDEAVLHLEQIVVRDPAHLVANKLLVETYAGVGRTDDAREKLDIYEMMGAGDADIERLHELLEAAERRGNSQSAELEPAAGPGDVPSEASEGIRREDDQPFAPALAPGRLSDYWQEVAEEGIFTFEPPEEPLELDQPEELDEPGAVGNSTVTLGELYREQGHREEAVEVFEEVLTREPENRAARRGLEVTREPEPAAVPVAPAVGDAGDTSASEEGSTSGLVERKKQALTAYLGRIRRADASGI